MDWEIVASIVVLGGLLWVAFKGGRSNPVSTGDLEKRVYDDIHKMKNKMQEMVGTFASKDDIKSLRDEMKDAASSDELKEVAKEVTTVCEKVQGLEKAADRTEAGVKRIENFFLAKGISGQ